MGLLDTLGQISSTLRGVNDLFGNMNQFQNVINPNPQMQPNYNQNFYRTAGFNPNAQANFPVSNASIDPQLLKLNFPTFASTLQNKPLNFGQSQNQKINQQLLKNALPTFYSTLQQPVGGYGGNPPPVNTPFPTTPFPQQPTIPQPQPNTFANRLKDFGNIYADYIIGRSNAGKASFDPSSGDEAFVNNSGLANAMNQYKNREALKTLQAQQAFDNQMSALNTQTSQQKNFQYRQSLPPQEQKEFDKYLTSSSKGNLPASIQEYQYLQQIRNAFGNNSQQEKDFFKLKRRGFDVKDLGNSLAVIDNTGTIIQTIPKGVTPDNQPQNIIQKKEAEAMGKELGNLKLQYPTIKADLRDKIQTIDRILNYKDLDSYLGAIQGRGFTNKILDSERQDFLADLEKITSQEFLAQFGKLRGGGSITEAEGAKATSASTTLRPTLSEKRFRQELKRLKEVAELGVQRKYGQIKSIESGNFDIDTPSKVNEELFYNEDTGELLDSKGNSVK